MLRRKRKAGTAEGEAKVDPKNTEANPYIANQEADDDRYMNQAVSRQNWIRAFQIVCALLAVSIGFNGYYATQSKFIPYIVEVDKIGHVVHVGFVDKAKPIDTKRIVRTTMMEWVANSRAVVSDQLAMKRTIEKVYAHVGATSKVKKQLDAYYKERQVFDLAAKQTISAEVTLAIPRGGNTWEIEWNEKRYSQAGEEIGFPERWKAIITYDFVVLDKEEAITANPTGIFVTEFSWSKQL